MTSVKDSVNKLLDGLLKYIPLVNIIVVVLGWKLTNVVHERNEQEKIRNSYFEPMVVKVYFDKEEKNAKYNLVTEGKTLEITGEPIAVDQLKGAVAYVRAIVDDGRMREMDTLDATEQFKSDKKSNEIKIHVTPTLADRRRGTAYPQLRFADYYLLVEGMNDQQKQLYLVGYLVDSEKKSILKTLIFDEIDVKLYRHGSTLPIEGKLMDVSSQAIDATLSEESYGKQLLANGMKHELENYVKLAKDLGTWNE